MLYCFQRQKQFYRYTLCRKKRLFHLCLGLPNINGKSNLPICLIISISMAIMGIGEGLLVSAKLGNAPWTVLSPGLALQTGMSIGWAIALISLIVLLFWIPFKLKFGLGTITQRAHHLLFYRSNNQMGRTA